MVLTNEQIFKALGRRVREFKAYYYSFDNRSYMFRCIAEAKKQGYIPFQVDLKALWIGLLKR